MMRSFFIYLSKATWARQMVTQWKVAWRAASRFVAGEKIEDAIRVIEVLNGKGINATLDHLGEHTTNPDEARRATQDILQMIEAINTAGVKANASIKLTQIGLSLDKELCAENLRHILEFARGKNNFVRIDMEDSSCVEITLDLYTRMRDKYGLTNTGLVIQSYLYRSEKDIQRLASNGTPVRLCKGAYKEPPEVAFPKKKDVDANYDHLADLLITCSQEKGFPLVSTDGKFPPIPAIASHDPRRIEHGVAQLEQVKMPKRAIEFQLLYGIRRDLQEQLVSQGYPVRVYVPYGTQWYPYYVRRLAERPANLWFFISNFFRK